MGKKIGERFEYTPPAGWTEFQQGSQWVYQGPGGQELILSASFVSSPTLSAASPQEIGDRLLADGLAAVQDAAEHPDLRIVKPLSREEGLCPLPVWTIVAETIKKDILFVEAVVSQPNAVLLITIEGPHSPGLISALRELLLTVRAVE